MERKLASIEKIEKVWTHPNADALDLVKVRGWQCVVKRDEFKEGDLCVYFEIDSFLPIRDEFEFLRANCLRKMDDVEGFRLRTIKLRKELSQGLALPITILNGLEIETNQNVQCVSKMIDVEGTMVKCIVPLEAGADVTEFLGVQKWEPPLPSNLMGQRRGNFPSYVRKTDQERCQNIWGKLKHLPSGSEFEVTEKLDGSSCTIGYFEQDGVFVCSRNINMKLDGDNSENNAFVQIATKTNLLRALDVLKKNVAVQGELCGPTIQGNKYKLQENRLYVFDVWDINEQRYMSRFKRMQVLDELRAIGADFYEVPVLNLKVLPETLEELLSLAEGKSMVNDKTEREGIVWKSMYMPDMLSFKAISNKFLLKYDDDVIPQDA
jgi:RNA ligase (TIGR02306 family)